MHANENSAALNCEWECLKAGCPCKRCGYNLKRDYTKAPARQCRNQTDPPSPQPIYLGTKIKNGLNAIGITQDRVTALVESIGLPPSCGGCAKRQEAIDDFDRKARAWLKKAKAWLRRQA